MTEENKGESNGSGENTKTAPVSTELQAPTQDTSLTNLVGAGQKAFSLKRYEEAAEHFSEAAEAYSSEHGEDSANILLQYGRALFEVAVQKSQILGGVPTEKVTAAAESVAGSSGAAGEGKNISILFLCVLFLIYIYFYFFC